MSDSTGLVRLKPGREKPVLHAHPWVFSGAIADAEADSGAIVDVVDAEGRFLARGYFNAASQIRVRLLTWDEDESITPAFWRRRIEGSIARRDDVVIPPRTNAMRLVNAESDGLPGLIVDRYDRWVVVQALTLGIDEHLQLIVDLLVEHLAPDGVYERSDEDVRKLEGLKRRSGVLWGGMPPVPLEIEEHGLRYFVDVRDGQKTGFYIDQRDTRALIHRLARSRRVLNCFSYTGSFTVAAAAGGAGATVNVERNAGAVDLAVENLKLNDLDGRADEDAFVVDHVADALRRFRQEGREFDLIILDPPKFAYTKKQVQSAARGYKDINRIAFHLLAPDGLLATFSCSGLVSADLFQKIVFGAAIDARVNAQILGYLHQAPDHPISLTFPEGAYLKGLLCRVGPSM